MMKGSTGRPTVYFSPCRFFPYLGWGGEGGGGGGGGGYPHKLPMAFRKSRYCGFMTFSLFLLADHL